MCAVRSTTRGLKEEERDVRSAPSLGGWGWFTSSANRQHPESGWRLSEQKGDLQFAWRIVPHIGSPGYLGIRNGNFACLTPAEIWLNSRPEHHRRKMAQFLGGAPRAGKWRWQLDAQESCTRVTLAPSEGVTFLLFGSVNNRRLLFSRGCWPGWHEDRRNA